jgi:hypothetical protein
MVSHRWSYKTEKEALLFGLAISSTEQQFDK